MQGVLIDDHRIHVDFSQSVSKLSDSWRTSANAKRAGRNGGFGGIQSLEKKRQYRAMDAVTGRSRGYGMVFDRDDIRERRDLDLDSRPRKRSRSHSPRHHQNRSRHSPPSSVHGRRDSNRNRRSDGVWDQDRWRR